VILHRTVVLPAPVFTLELDTTAPVVTWGAVGGTTAGELLQVAYTLDDPELLEATLRLVDGREVAMDVLGDRLELLLPADAYNGPATVRALVRDDVGNQATRELVVAITGVPYTPPEPPTPPPAPGGGGRPRPARERSRRRVQSRSRLRTRSAAVATVRRRSHAVTAVDSSAAIAGARRGRTVVAVASRNAVRHERSVSTAVAASSTAIVRRRDGEEFEALLLDLW
jgi:hypothetical protein